MDQNLLEISDGRLYRVTDMPRVGCHDCAGCSSCCRGMGDSILLDPYDMDQLSRNLGMSFEQMLDGPVELHLEEGLILPNLKMNEDDHCPFLNEEGRCSVHSFRPGLCRLFPLGRNYETDEKGQMTLSYFVLTHECPVTNRTKMKISKWLGIGQIREYQDFLIRWHALTKAMRAEVTAEPDKMEENRKTSMRFLQFFYQKPYTAGDFFREFEQRAKLLG